MRYFFPFLLILTLAGSLPAQNIPALRSRAAAGDSVAMMELSEKFMFGMGVEKSEDSSQYWVRKAADSGHPEAAFLMGNQLTRRVFDQKKFDEGINWMKKAAASGSVDAMLKLLSVYSDDGSNGGETTSSSKYYSPTEAFKYSLQLAEAGNSKGALYAARAYLKGKGVSRNDSAGIAWFYFLADKKKEPWAQNELGELFLEGKHTQGPDIWEALRLFTLARQNERSNVNMRSQADIGIHAVDQILKASHNLMMQSSFLLPPGTFRYPLRE